MQRGKLFYFADGMCVMVLDPCADVWQFRFGIILRFTSVRTNVGAVQVVGRHPHSTHAEHS